MNRRRFFREGLRELLKPLADSVEQLAEAARQFSALDEPAPARRPLPQLPSAWLRPPGALPEDRFLDTCSRCGDCVRVCPAQSIIIDPMGVSGGGAPYIDPETMACVVCEGLVCMSHCPTGALVPTLLADIDMGTAEWHEDMCLRRHGDSCQLCVDKCPLGSAAIRLEEGRIQVVEEGCIGCGVCQHECPTYPKSITITPSVRSSD